MKSTPIPDHVQNLVDDGFLSVAEACAFLKISRAKLYVLMEQAEIRYAKMGGCRRIPRRAVVDYASKCMVG